MKTLIIACSVRANELMKELKKALDNDDPLSENLTAVKCSRVEESFEESLTEFVGKNFNKVDRLVFVCATGIAVRAIAPYLNHKSVDPAVVVLDETGRYCISLLSGHAGGANTFAEKLSELIGATPVITTATDNEGKFAVDEFARKNNLVIGNWKLAKEVSVRILEDENVYFCSDVPVSGFLPEGLIAITPEELYGISMEKTAVHITSDFELEEISEKYGDDLQILKLVPKHIAVGIGCKKNTSAKKIRKAISSCMEECGFDIKAINSVASIDLKKEEAGIIEFCAEQEVDFYTFSAEELDSLEGDFSESDFVESITGISNVCERCAVMLAEKIEHMDEVSGDIGPDGSLSIEYYEEDEEDEIASDEENSNVPDSLICTKKVYDGVTVALAEIDFNVTF